MLQRLYFHHISVVGPPGVRRTRALVTIRVPSEVDHFITKPAVGHILLLRHEQQQQEYPKHRLPDPRTANHKNANRFWMISSRSQHSCRMYKPCGLMYRRLSVGYPTMSSP
ncbi:TPA: hypothetical protein N0F65_002663 [Lagenidium giganteum]|uniref:Uncharacterized protein n=1 Tax=Lagenidium giganteum TaxID=4803 RepID=A0AAV2Z6U7_9STRA|nr:TPA: hypothetical protein N0F65_002663 [Lagenidium giganteum]